MVRRARVLLLVLACLLEVRGGAALAVTQTAAVQANVVKPLTLTWLQDFDLGTIALGPGNWSGATVTLSRAGILSCTNPKLTCTGATKTARYNVTGTNKMVVRITAPNVTLVNATNASQTLTLVVDSPGTVMLTSSGAPGNDFDLGGSITFNSTTASGNYSGKFNVTVDYQ